MHDHEIKLDIATPNGLFEHTFPRTAEVGKVIVATVRAKDLNPDEKFELVYQDQVLQPIERMIGSFGLPDDVKLELTATGSGV